tara:strand:+ start:1958 stop:2371 length:414 start_codon:yes stop_codon:yes gene_type:complete
MGMFKVKIMYLQRIISVLALLLLSVRVLSADGIHNSTALQGQWKLSDKPVWIEIIFVQNRGAGQIYRNDKKPSAVGQLLFSEISQNDNKNWEGLIYVPQLGRNHPMVLELTNPQLIEVKVRVGLVKRTIRLNKLDQQ